jgi:antitoxin ParD1/3/4
MSILIPPELEAFVAQEVASGKYRSRKEVISEGLRLLREHQRKLDQLRADIQVGLDQLERGEGVVLQDQQAGRDFVDDIAWRGGERLTIRKSTR